MKNEKIYQAIYDKYIVPTKIIRKNYIGVEIELPIVNMSGGSTPEDAVHDIAELFSNKFGFTAAGWDSDGFVTMFENGENGDILSFDCSYSNLELSFGKAKTLFEVYDRFKSYYGFLNDNFITRNCTLTGMGINPNAFRSHGKPILPLFDAAEIPVIRLGLNPTDELSGGAALAGAYHPALGELVRSRVLRNRAEQEMEKLHCKGQFVSIRVPEKKLSQMLGQKRCNVDWLKERFHLAGLEVCPDREVTDLVIEKDPIALS